MRPDDVARNPHLPVDGSPPPHEQRGPRWTRDGRWAVASAFLTALAVFGPYLNPVLGTGALPGLRTEQVVVYGSAMLLVPLTFSRIRADRCTILVGLALLTTLTVAVIGGIWPPFNNTPYERNSLLAGIDNMVLPLVVLLLVRAWLTVGDRRRLLNWVLLTVVVTMCINTAIALLSIMTDLTPVLGTFWTSDTVAPSTAQLAAGNSRYSGIFNQPAEAGVMYGVALLGVLYLWRNRVLLLTASFLTLTVGGMLTVSKIFVVVAFPLAVWQLVRIREGRAKRLAVVGSVSLVAAVLGQFFLLAVWSAGMTRLMGLIRPHGGLLSFYTAGRLGSNATLTPVVDAVLHMSPWFGAGAYGLDVPYDNGWIEALVMAGIIGVVSYTFLFLVMGYAWYRQRGVEPDVSGLGGYLLLVAAAGSVGLPVLTANRDTTVVWIVLGLTLLAGPAASRAVPGTTADRRAPVREPAKSSAE